MTELRPAFTSQFAPDVLPSLQPLLPIEGISPEWAWDGATGEGIKIAFLDSGVEANHPAIGGRLAQQVAITLDDNHRIAIEAEPGVDLYGHGTACAGVVRQVAPDAELHSARVLGKTLGGKGEVLLAGMRWAVEHEMRVVNLSLGTTKANLYAALHDLADLAYFRNVIFVCAANDMPVRSYPWAFASVISVCAHDDPDPYHFYYNPTPPVEFAAPGIRVRVPWVNAGWATLSANSFAAPHITGIVARILSKHPELTSIHIKAVLRALSQNVLHPARTG